MSTKASGAHLTVRALQPLAAGLEALGTRAAPILRAAGIRPDLLENPDAKVPSGLVSSMWMHALDATQDDMLGLHLAEAAPIETFDVHAYALLSSRTLREAYRRASRYQKLIHETTRLDFEEGPEHGVLVHTLPGGRPVGRHPAEFLVTAWVRIGRLVVDRAWVPGAVYFAHEPAADRSEYDRYFRAPVHFQAGRNALRLPNTTLDSPSAAGDERLASIMDRHVGAMLASQPSRKTLADEVRACLLAELHGAQVSAAIVASSLHVSERGLRRRLATEGTSYRELLDRVRLERAVALLTERRCSIAEIAYLVGFSELSAFHRAFKRWTGRTPAEVRAGAPAEGAYPGAGAI